MEIMITVPVHCECGEQTAEAQATDNVAHCGSGWYLKSSRYGSDNTTTALIPLMKTHAAMKHGMQAIAILHG
jgi:hypothetical protein